MSIFQKIISASLSPNAEFDDVVLAFSVLMRPWKWRKGHAVHRVEAWFEKYFDSYRAVSFNSGRSALLAILKSFNISKGDEVIVQAFTCVAVPDSVLWAGATPVYVDIDSSLNIDPNKLQGKITSKTRAIIVQHTMGSPAQMNIILAMAKKNNILVIEDCAHSLGAFLDGKKVGSLSDASFFSFGRDKVVSSVFGGMALVHKRYESQLSTLKNFHRICQVPGLFWIFQQLLHPILFAIILPLYRSGVGKIIIVVSQRIGLLSIPVFPEEKVGKKPSIFPSQYPNALAQLLVLQLTKLEKYNAKRKKIAFYYEHSLRNNERVELLPYQSDSIYLRYSILMNNPEVVIQKAKRHGILLGNWYHNVIDPSGVTFRAVGFAQGSCKKADEIASRIINLPTNISQRQATAVVSSLE